MSSKLADAPFAMRPPHLHLEQARVLVANSVEVQLGTTFVERVPAKYAKFIKNLVGNLSA